MGTLASAMAAFQAPAAQPAPMVIEVEKLKDNFYVLRGGGGNTAVLITAGGVSLVDTKIPGWGKPLIATLKEITDKPVSSCTTLVAPTPTQAKKAGRTIDDVVNTWKVPERLSGYAQPMPDRLRQNVEVVWRETKQSTPSRRRRPIRARNY